MTSIGDITLTEDIEKAIGDLDPRRGNGMAGCNAHGSMAFAVRVLLRIEKLRIGHAAEVVEDKAVVTVLSTAAAWAQAVKVVGVPVPFLVFAFVVGKRWGWW